jgi:antitoxin Phd
MRHWALQDAKARLSELVETSLREGPQMVTRRGVDTVVVVPVEEWKKLTDKPRKSAMDVLVHDPRRFELDLPKRSELFGLRDPLEFD